MSEVLGQAEKQEQLALRMGAKARVMEVEHCGECEVEGHWSVSKRPGHARLLGHGKNLVSFSEDF